MQFRLLPIHQYENYTDHYKPTLQKDKMSSFFEKNIASIKSIEIPDFGWRKAAENNHVIQWINPEETIGISINFFDLAPDLPTVTDLDALRSYYRQSIAAVNGGIIAIDILKFKDIPVVKTIFKIPQQPSGITYLAALTIAFESCSYVVKVQCAEWGTTGLRDAVIARKLLANGTLTLGENGYENWFADPYDDTFKNGTLMNQSEQSIYDKDFPGHPLTQARVIIEKLSKGLIFRPEIEQLSPFRK